MERRGVDDWLQGAERGDGGALRIQVEQVAAPSAAARRRAGQVNLHSVLEDGSHSVLLATSPARHGRGKSKQSLLVGHGTMGLVLCLWCAHQYSETQSTLPRRTLDAHDGESGASYAVTFYTQLRLPSCSARSKSNHAHLRMLLLMFPR